MRLTIHEAASFMKIELTISQPELKLKYRELARLYHSDISSLPNAEELMKKLNVAYDLLKEKVPMRVTTQRSTTFTTTPNRNSDFFGGIFPEDAGFNKSDPFFASTEEMKDAFRDMWNRAYERSQQQKQSRPYNPYDDPFNKPPPPKQGTKHDWKRSQAGNLYRTTKDNTRIIIICSKGGYYKIMAANDNSGEKKFFPDAFMNENLAQAWADLNLAGLT